MAVDSIGYNIASRSTTNTKKANTPSSYKGDGSENVMDMDAFLKLLAAQLQNQDVMNPMGNNEFMEQMVQMATVTAMNTFTDISMQTYAASLVGKDITVAEVDKDNNITEIYGTVTGAGLYGGEQVVFIDNDKSYYLSQIMAVGKLPPKKEEDSDDKVDGDNNDQNNSGSTDNTEKA